MSLFDSCAFIEVRNVKRVGLPHDWVETQACCVCCCRYVAGVPRLSVSYKERCVTGVGTLAGFDLGDI
jgi:hypothetical protein